MVKPEPSWRSHQRWSEKKKKGRSLPEMKALPPSPKRGRWSGPPMVPPNWFSMRNGAWRLLGSAAFGSQKPPCLLRLLHAFSALSLWNQKPEPWNSLPPDLVMALKTAEPLRPYSAVNWLVTSRTSWMRSGLLRPTVAPATPKSLLSCPSIMKLFERTRPPLAEKVVLAPAKVDCPVTTWLTPGAERATR